VAELFDEFVVGKLPAGLRYFGLPLGRVFAGAVFFLLGSIRVKGKDHIPARGGVLILANHRSDLDPVVLQYVCPRPSHCMAKSELFGIPVLGWLIRKFGGFPVKRGEADRKALKFSIDLLKAGEAVSIFPEGQLSQDGELQELKPGIALIARMSGMPVICCGLDGTNRMMPYGRLIPRLAFRATRAAWGTPRTFTKDDAPETILEWVRSELLRLTST